jgi:hypothetical protein
VRALAIRGRCDYAFFGGGLLDGLSRRRFDGEPSTMIR